MKRADEEAHTSQALITLDDQKNWLCSRAFDEYETIGKKSELMSSMFLSLILFIGFILYSLLMLQLLCISFVSDFLATS